MNWQDITNELLINAYKKNNYILKDGIYQANVFGIRANPPIVNTFCDIVGILRKDNGNSWNVLLCNATTDPGTYYLEHPMNVKGTAIVIPGQYLGSHKTGLHKGYRALVQCGKLRVWRDNDKDDTFDHENPQDSEGDGIDIHHAGEDSTVVYNWSAACQIIAKMTEFNTFMSQIDDHLSQGYKDLFDYTLFSEEDL